jgi:hypothetical protein
MSIILYCYATETEQCEQLEVGIVLPLVKVKIVDFIHCDEWFEVTLLCVKW